MSDKAVKDLSRVMRLPRFWHRKKDQPHMVTFEVPGEQANIYRAATLLKHFPPIENERSHKAAKKKTNPIDALPAALLSIISGLKQSLWPRTPLEGEVQTSLEKALAMLAQMRGTSIEAQVERYNAEIIAARARMKVPPALTNEEREARVKASKQSRWIRRKRNERRRERYDLCPVRLRRLRGRPDGGRMRVSTWPSCELRGERRGRLGRRTGLARCR